MALNFISPLLLLLFVASFTTRAEPAADLVPRSAPRIVIKSSSASLAGGKATLLASTLRRQEDKYIGSYQLKVTPYFFKSESGSLSVAVSDESLSKLAAGSPVSCAGMAVSAGSRKGRAITVKAIPASVGSRNGTLTIKIPTENGELLFTPSYALNGH